MASIKFWRSADSKFSAPTEATSSIRMDSLALTRWGVVVFAVSVAAVDSFAAPAATAAADRAAVMVIVLYPPVPTRGMSTPMRGSTARAKIDGTTGSTLTPVP